jgi:hypothetical protein
MSFTAPKTISRAPNYTAPVGDALMGWSVEPFFHFFFGFCPFYLFSFPFSFLIE